ncbi:MAG: hypothetical protein ACREX3_03105 [Gammaproteobacteria bacterium]
MSLRKIARRHPFLWLAGLAILVMAFGRFVTLEYDDRSIGTVWFVLTYVLTWPYQLASDTIARLNGGRDLPFHAGFTFAVGTLIYVVLDAGLSRLSKPRGGDTSAHTVS